MLPAVISAAFVVGSRSDATCNPSTWLNGTDFHGDGQGLSHGPGKSAADCCTQCTKIAGCNFFSFAYADPRMPPTCWFFKDNKGPRKQDGVISGAAGSAPAPSPPAPVPPAPTPKPAPTPPNPPPSPPAPVPPGGKPVQVFILMGQSNMLGEGKVDGDTAGSLEYAVKTEHLYPYLWDAKTGTWAVRNDVRNVFVMGSGGPDGTVGKVQQNEWMGVNSTKKTIGPELGIGNFVGNYTGSPTMMLKSCIGNRALGWDLLPPGSKGYEYTDSKGQVWEYAAYHQSPHKWEKGTTPKPISWVAGIQYDGDTNRSKIVLDNLATYYPGATKYEVAGFFWWQGDRDHYDSGDSDHYEQNLVNLINTLRKDFNAPKAKFVTASLGQTVKGSTANDGKILNAMLNVDGNSGKYPEFKGNVAAVYTHPLSKGSSSSAHYGGNAETYMNVGEAMGSAMVELLKSDAA